ncbi:hypothetical protein HOO54_03060 [Bacillus sp. WMMC1349]|nr:hypothetical protein [Bacillus sp. WMMC1349]
MKKLILKKLFDLYPEIQDDYGWDLNEEERAKYLPDINSSGQLFDLIELCNIHIHDVSNDGMAYVGYELACTWEEEHGLGVMTHKNRIVAIGGADTSILSWIPISSDGSGNHIGIDLDPDKEGKVGQVINFGADEEVKYVIAYQLKDFLIHITNTLKEAFLLEGCSGI